MTDSEHSSLEPMSLDDVDTGSQLEKHNHTATEKASAPQSNGDSGDGTRAGDQILHGVPLLLCGLSLLLSMFLVALDQTIIATILSTVGNKFGDFGKVSWISSGFLLPTSVLAMSWGKISLIFGRKYTMLVSIGLFEIGSLICALANSMNMLIGGRVIAGIGGGGVQVMVFVILTEIVTIEKRGIAQGLVGMAYGISSVVAPLVGGVLTQHASWRWCFYINLPIGGVAFACIFWFFNPPLPRGTLRQKLLMIDYIGTALLATGLTLLLLALTFGSVSTPWNSGLVISFFVVGGVSLIAFCGYNFFISKNPLIPWAVARVVQVLCVCAAFFTMFASFISSFLYLATFFQVVRNSSPMGSGLELLPLIIPVVCCSIGGGLIITRYGYTKPLATFGGVCGAIGYGLCTMLDENSPPAKRIGYLILPGFGTGLTLQSMMINCQLAAPKENGGVLIATAMVALFRATGGAVGSSLGQTLQSVVFRSQLEKHRDQLPADVDFVQLINEPSQIRQLPLDVQPIAIKAFVSGFQKVMFFAMACMVCTTIFSLFFTNKRIPVAKKSTKPKDTEASPKLDAKEVNSASTSSAPVPASENAEIPA